MTTASIIKQLNYDCEYNTTRDYIAAHAASIINFAAQHCSLDNNLNELLDGLDSLARLIESDYSTPEEFFELECYGHFKECYYLSPDMVIKFCAKRNPTLEEKSVLEAAQARGLDYAFVPSLYIPLPREIASENLDKDDDDMEIYNADLEEWVDNPDWEDDTIFNYLCIQPRVQVEGEENEPDPPFNCIHSCSLSGWTETRNTLHLPDDIEREDLRGVDGVNLPWAERFVTFYGVNALLQLSLFCEELHIWDLHSENVGYTRKAIQRPVILDWMSR